MKIKWNLKKMIIIDQKYKNSFPFWETEKVLNFYLVTRNGGTINDRKKDKIL